MGVYKDYAEAVNLCLEFDLAKSRDDLGLVSGWANVSVNRDGSIPMDWQDDIIPIKVLEKAAIDFMENCRDCGVNHEGHVVGTVVESIVFTKEKQAAMGIPEGIVPEGWFITAKLKDKETFDLVKSKQLRMFSIQGKYKKFQL